MKRFSSLLLVAVVALGLTLTGCDSNSTDDGSMTMTMTESSKSTTTASKSTSKSHVGDLQKAEMVVSDVTVVSENSDDETSVLTTESFTVDLKKLNSGLEENIDDFSIPVNPSEGYGQIRLKTGSEAVKLTLKDGTEKTARVASSEIKLNFSPAFTVDSPDDRVDVTVDWDVEESLKGREAGSDLAQNGLVITPVVQAEATVTSATDDGNSN
jgi:hypothetical protein